MDAWGAAVTSPEPAFTFVGDKLTGKVRDTEVVSCEPTACPTLTGGLYVYDYGNMTSLISLVTFFLVHLEAGYTHRPSIPKIAAGGGVAAIFFS